MSGFDSPIGRCEAVKEMVLLDETQAECAAEHGCKPGQKCPLEGCFAQVSGLSDEHAEALAADAADAAVARAGCRQPENCAAPRARTKTTA